MKISGYFLPVLCLVALAGCAAGGSPNSAARDPQTEARAPLNDSGQSGGTLTPAAAAAAATDSPDAVEDPEDARRLDALWKTRAAQANSTDYPIGPGDEVEISVPPIDELKERLVRVDTDGTFSLPLLGTVQAGGLTEEQLRQTLSDRLKKYMFNPEIDVFVKEYKSRQVAVVGEVMSPGLVTLTGPNESVLDVLTHAGGLGPAAADELILLPAESNAPDTMGRVTEASALASNPLRNADVESDARTASATDEGSGASARARTASMTDPAALVSPEQHPILIALKSTALSGDSHYLNLPVRPGDVIIVPGGGEVMVVGWVQNPGHFRVGSGLTVLGAIGAAGGPMYAADTSGIDLIRSERDGSKVSVPINLDKIESGEEADPPVHGNDVINVPYSNVKIGPYVFYQVLTKMMLGGPTIPAP